MSDYGTNRMLRIATLLEWLEYREGDEDNDRIGESLGLTIARFAEVLRVPLVTIREDIYELAVYNKGGMIQSVESELNSTVDKLQNRALDETDENEDDDLCVDMKNDPSEKRALVFNECLANQNHSLPMAEKTKEEQSESTGKKRRNVTFEQLIKNGYFDDVPLESGFLKSVNKVDRIVLVLQDEEMEALREFADANDVDLKLAGKRSVYFKNLYSVSDRELLCLEKLMKDKCLQRDPGKEKKIRFYYDSPKIDGITEKVVVPLMIEQDLDTGFLYLIAESKEPDQPGARFRLDRMVSFDKVEAEKPVGKIQKKVDEKDQKFFEREKSREAEKENWDKEYTHVKIKVFDRHGYDIHSRVIRDLQRMHIGNVYSIDDHMKRIENADGYYYLYEDDVLNINISKLKSWVFSYGSSMVVIEPESLRDQVIESYKKRKQYYESVNSNQE